MTIVNLIRRDHGERVSGTGKSRATTRAATWIRAIVSSLERVNRDVSRESRTARLRSLLLRLLLPPRFSSSTFLSCASPCYIDIRPRTRSPHNAAFAVEESDVLRRACRPRACARAYAFGSLVRLLSFLLTCAYRPIEMYLRTHEREKGTKVEAINPPARRIIS